MGYDIQLLEFLDVTYLPDDEHLPGFLGIRCLLKEWGWREIERGFHFQYDSDNKKLFYVAYPVVVQLPIGEASTVEEAIEQAKQFLTKWLGDDTEFRLKTAAEIRRLEEAKRGSTPVNRGS